MEDWQKAATLAVSGILESVGSGSVGSRVRDLMELAYLQGIIRGTELALDDIEKAAKTVATDMANDIRRNLREGA